MSTQVRRNAASSAASGHGGRVGGAGAQLGLQRALAGGVPRTSSSAAHLVGPARHLHGHRQVPARSASCHRSDQPSSTATTASVASRRELVDRGSTTVERRCRAGPTRATSSGSARGTVEQLRPRAAAGTSSGPTRSAYQGSDAGPGARPRPGAGGPARAGRRRRRRPARGRGPARPGLPTRAGDGSCGVIDMRGRLLDLRVTGHRRPIIGRQSGSGSDMAHYQRDRATSRPSGTPSTATPGRAASTTRS